MMKQSNEKTKVFIALFSLYLSWSTTFLAIKYALEGFPPFFMAGFRFFIVGCGLSFYLIYRGEPAPNRSQWANALVIGGFLILGGTGGLCYAQQWVASGIAALVTGTSPLWITLFMGLWGEWPHGKEWTGLLLGFTGLLILNIGSNLWTYPVGALALAVSVSSWSFGSAFSRRLSLPKGLMAGAIQMITGGSLLLIASFAAGEKFNCIPSLRSIAAVIYLAFFGSLVGYSAYIYLLTHVRPSIATSYNYVNPVLAVILGWFIAGERITKAEISAMFIIVTGVLLIVTGLRKKL